MKNLISTIHLKITLAICALIALQLQTAAQATCSNDEFTVIVTIATDQYGDETSWRIFDNVTDVTYDSINFDIYAGNTTYFDTVCIPSDACFTFRIWDSYSDGITGNGGFNVTVDTDTIIAGSNFGRVDFASYNCNPSTTCESALNIQTGNYTTFSAEGWYIFQPPQLGEYAISTCSPNVCDTKIWIYESCEDNINESNTGTIFYNDNSTSCGVQAQLTIPLDTAQIYYIRIGERDDNTNCQSNMVDWSLEYLGPLAGCTDILACNYNPIATISDNSCVYPTDSIPCPAPDLVIDEEQLRNSLYLEVRENQDSCLIDEGCIQGYGYRELLRFDTKIKNIGTVDFYIGNDENDETNQFSTENCHGHPHYEGYAEYILFDQNANRLPIGSKVGFCVLDLICPPEISGKYNCNNMGITAGCWDIYAASIDCQWIDVTNVEDGKYTLVARTNWDNSPDALGRYESDFHNNWAQVCIELFTSASGIRTFEISEQCTPYTDCEGQLYGNAQPDCTGTCNGTTAYGDLNQNGVQEIEDAFAYITQILGNDISPTPCNDLNADNQITVYDAALLASCLSTGNTHQHIENIVHNHCTFPQGINNIYDTISLHIAEINEASQYIDIHIHNPNSGVNAYQFTMSGLQIMTIENLATEYITQTQAILGNNTIIGISYQGNYLPPSQQTQALCRIHYLNTTTNKVCIDAIQSIVNQNIEQLITQINGDCITLINTENPTEKLIPSLHPNPFDKHTIFNFPNTTQNVFSLKIIDSTGRLIRQYNDIRTNTFKLERGTLESGVYLYQLESDKKIATGKFIVQ